MPAPWQVKAEVGAVMRAKTHHVGGVINLLYPPPAPYGLGFRICDIKRMVEPWRIELQTFALRTRRSTN